MTRPDPRRLDRRYTESDYVQPEAVHVYPLNQKIQMGTATYYYRGYYRDPYGIITYFVAVSPDGQRLVKVSKRRAATMVAVNGE